MTYFARRAGVLFSGISFVALTIAAPAFAQTAQQLDPITVLATKTEEKAIDALAGVSTVREEQIKQIMPTRTSDLFFGLPGVWWQQRGDNPESSISIRGLQDFGRVAVIVDGARQNFQRTGHNANGTFYLEPELLAGLDVVRGPVANIYGSGAIGGVASFRTKDADDILRPGERMAALSHVQGGSNGAGGLGSFFAAARPNANADVIMGGTYRRTNNFQDGNGITWNNTASETATGLAKVAVRPMDGHQVKLSSVYYESWYSWNQTQFQESPQRANTINATNNLRWTYSRPDDNVWNFDGNVYWNRTDTKERKLSGSANGVTGSVGNERRFLLDTYGFDLNNTSRGEWGGWRNALTIGGDMFNDMGSNTDPGGNSDQTTPSGRRTVGGAFVQMKSNYQNFLELIGAARFDTYELSGQGVTTSGSRVSPKGTIGITPIQWFTLYGTYAEGYRAPALTETVVSGNHPMPFNAGPGNGFSYCSTGVKATGTASLFCFLPNPNLKPEVGKTKEVGFNIKHDNLFTANDKLRIKANVFRNDLEDYIQSNITVPVTVIPFNQGLINYQFVNVPRARIDGVELEANYDAGDWFAGVAVTRLRGKNTDTGAPLASVPPDQVASTFGVRWLDRKLTTAVRWTAVAAKRASDIPQVDLDGDGVAESAFQPTASYNLVNIYVGYEPTPDVLVSFGVDNILDQFYIRYSDALPNLSAFGQTTPGVAIPGPGITYKAGMQIRFAAM